MSFAVRLVDFPATPVAMLTHRGPPATEHDRVRVLVAWKLRHGFTDPLRHRHYGIHHDDPRTTRAEDHRVDFCLSLDGAVPANDLGIVAAVIPAARCAVARDVGSRHDNQAARWLGGDWLPRSGFALAAPPIFHYVNVGPTVPARDMITDVYLPLRPCATPDAPGPPR
jgi:AraC family transcriptional regulator